MASDQNDSLEFVAKYKDWITSNRMNVSPSMSPIDISQYLVSVRESVDKKAFDILGVDTKALDSSSARLAKELGGIKDLITAYQRSISSDAKAEIEKACKGKEELKPFAQAYLFRMILKNIKLDFCLDAEKQKIFSGAKKERAKEDAVPKNQTDAIWFIAKYKNWIAIKKMNIRDNTKPEEIAMHLASVRLTVDKKGFELAGVNTTVLNEYADRTTGKLRKSLANLTKIAEVLNSEELRNKVEDASAGKKEIAEVAQIYIFKKLLENLKFDFDVSPEALSSVYPGLKLPGRRGRKPKA